ncbi:MAG TPA: RNA 2',3'-cyclic phosphodiesterase [Gemmatimonadaceae bacterium]|nr:RNA 2',3'-cyclic phosphodiesterase [Gemmatimonadaceae bacterium]
MRLFLAINLPAPLRRAIFDATAPLRAAAPSLAWVAEPNLHLTLKFFGERPESEATSLARALDAVASGHAPVTLALGGLGAFPNQRRPRVVWLGIAPDPKLELLHHDVEAACAALGYELEGRAFRPHLTLARVRPARGGAERPGADAAARALAGAAREVRFRETAVVETLDLMRSELAAGGSRYTVLHAAPLRGR